jgi:hypothetical protein
MRTVVRNSFARHTITAERVPTPNGESCSDCGTVRWGRPTSQTAPWLYRFHVADDQGSRQSGPIAGGKLFCSRSCAESYIGRSFDETR